MQRMFPVPEFDIVSVTSASVKHKSVAFAEDYQDADYSYARRGPWMRLVIDFSVV